MEASRAGVAKISPRHLKENPGGGGLKFGKLTATQDNNNFVRRSLITQ